MIRFVFPSLTLDAEPDMNIDEATLNDKLSEPPDEDPLFVAARQARIRYEVSWRMRHEEIMEDLERSWSGEED